MKNNWPTKEYHVTISVEGEIKAELFKFVQGDDDMSLEKAIDIVKEQIIKLEK